MPGLRDTLEDVILQPRQFDSVGGNFSCRRRGLWADAPSEVTGRD